jgi:hypothetical protein
MLRSDCCCARGQDGRPTRANRRQGGDAGLDDALRRGTDHEESRAAAAAVPGIYSEPDATSVTTLFRSTASATLADGGVEACAVGGEVVDGVGFIDRCYCEIQLSDVTN